MTTATRTRRKPASDAPKFDPYQEVTDQIVALLEAGTAPWRMPWSSAGNQLPVSMSTGKPYRGINPFLLQMATMGKGYSSPYWGTYNAIADLKGQVRKGEKGTLVVFWRRFETKEIDPETGKPKPAIVLRTYKVFNAEQADDLPARFYPQPADPADQPQNDPIEAVEQAIAGYLATGPLLDRTGSAAFYVPATDTITIPSLADHSSAAEHYSTLFHELGHSTGHKSRLNRPGVAGHATFGDAVYGREELVAEMTSAMVAGMVGILPATVDNSAAYLQSWIKTLKGEPKLAIQAAANAQRAADLILSVTHDTAEQDTASTDA